MKKCNSCKQEKSIDSFAKSKTNKDGCQSCCKTCSCRKAKEWYRLNKNKPQVRDRIKRSYSNRTLAFKAVVDDLKASKGCCACEENLPACLDFHHVGNKDKNIACLVAGHNLRRLCDELNKCVVICANCHRKHHAGYLEITTQTLIVHYDSLLHAVQKIDTATIGARNRIIAKRTVTTKPKVRRARTYKPREYSRKVARPDREELNRLLWQMPTEAIGRSFGVSGNAVAKWAKSYGLEKPARGYWTKLQWGKIDGIQRLQKH